MTVKINFRLNLRLFNHTFTHHIIVIRYPSETITVVSKKTVERLTSSLITPVILEFVTNLFPNVSSYMDTS